ncbi:hypothetical protein H4I96_00934 [Botrytis cinerea]
MTSVDIQALERTSDDVDKLNIIRAEMKKPGAGKDKAEFRRYDGAKDHVRLFYTEQHLKQTVEYNITVREEFRNRDPWWMGAMEGALLLNKFVDQSDPDTEVGQLEHLFQTSEAIREAGRPEWMVVAGFVHDLGKLWCLMGAKDSGILSEIPSQLWIRQTYDVMGHDEVLYQILKDQSTLPPEALAMIRYHSFYPWHFENEYSHFENEHDRAMKPWVKDFNQFDLYSKSDSPPDVEKLIPIYEEIFAKYFPDKVNFGKLAKRPTSSSSSSGNSSS